MSKIEDRRLYEATSSRGFYIVTNYLNNNENDINAIVYYSYVNKYGTCSVPEKTLLELAVNRGDLDMINYLLKKGADINKSAKDNRTSLSRAIEDDDLEIVKLWISKGADVNLINPNDGNTPLAMSVRCEKMDIAKYLIDVGANIWKAGKNGKAPLSWAVQRNNLKVITELLDYAVEVKHAIHIAFMRAIELQRFEIIQLLIKKGAVINFVYKNGHTPLTKATELRNLEIIKELIENGADVNMTDSNGNCSLIKAIEMRNIEIMRSIIEAGADLNVISKSGCSPLILAIQKENLEMVKYLVGKGVDVNKASDQKSPLFFAAVNYNIFIFQFLINSGADLLSVVEEIEGIASDNDDFFIYFNSLKKNMKKVADITSNLFTGHEKAS